MAFPLMALGAGLGQGMEAIQQQQQNALRQQMVQMQMQQIARQQQEQMQRQQAQAKLMSAFASGGVGPGMQPLSPMPTAGGSPDMGGGLRAGGALTGGRSGGWGPLAYDAAEEMRRAGASDAFIQGALANGLAEGGFQQPWQKAGGGENSFGHWQLNARGELPGYQQAFGGDQSTGSQARYLMQRAEQVAPGITKMNDPRQVTDLIGTKFERYRGAAPGQRYGQLAEVQRRMADWSPRALASGSADLAAGTGDFAIPSYGDAPAASADTVVTPPREGPSATTISARARTRPPGEDADLFAGNPRGQTPPPVGPRGDPGFDSDVYVAFGGPGWRDAGAPSAYRQPMPEAEYRKQQPEGFGAQGAFSATPQGGPQQQAAPEQQIQQQVRQGVQQVAQITPQQVYGRMSVNALAQQIQKAAPDADPVVQFMMLEEAQKLLAPDAKMQWEMFKQQHDESFQKEMELYRHNLRLNEPTTGTRLLQDQQGNMHEWRPGQAIPPGWHEAKGEGQPSLVESGGKQYWAKYGHPLEPVEVPGGGSISKVGTTKPEREKLDEQQARFWAKVLDSGGSLPPGLSRTGVVPQIMKFAGASGDPGDFIAKRGEVKANTTSLSNMTKMADAAISFEKLASRNFDVALGLAPDAIPTELGPFFNKWIEEGDKMLGNPEVPRYVAAIITGANEYAKVMSGSTGTAASTVDSRREAREMFSPYLSLPQISQVIAVAKADMANRENTLQDQVKTITARLGGKPAPSDSPTERPVGTPPRGSRSTAQPAATKEEPLPDWAKPYPDGQGFDVDGVVKIKKGDKFIVTPGAVKTP